MAGITPKHSEWCKPPKMCGSCQEALRERVVALSEKLTTSEAKLTKAHAVIEEGLRWLHPGEDKRALKAYRKMEAAAFDYREAALRGEGEG